MIRESVRRTVAPAVFGCVRAATRSRVLARALFGIDFRPLGEDETYFDATTLVLVRRAARRLTRGSRVLDMGTGTVAVVGLTLWKKLGCQVISVDVNPESVRLAQANIDRNRAPIRAIQSSFFEDVAEGFDAVVFNPPYVPTGAGLGRGLPERFRSQWDGGRDGLEVIERFLTAWEADRRGLLAIMGVNHRHAPRRSVLSLLEAHPGLRVEEIYRDALLPVDVYALTVEESP
jgi:methylase of polypeptide subunit release factors